jgi:protein ImuA
MQTNPIAILREQIRETVEKSAHDRVSSGSNALNQLLPGSGFRRGGLVEWLGDAGGGATRLAMIAAREACCDGRALIVVDDGRRFYPPAAAELGIELKHASFVFPATRNDFGWAVHQALACPAVSTVLCWPRRPDERMLRRWQLAAERGGGVGLLVRPAEARDSPTWADVRLFVEALPLPRQRRFRVTLLYGRGGGEGKSVELDLCNETHTLHLAPPLAAPTALSCPAGA